jgi:hypothetical protein
MEGIEFGWLMNSLADPGFLRRMEERSPALPSSDPVQPLDRRPKAPAGIPEIEPKRG